MNRSAWRESAPGVLALGLLAVWAWSGTLADARSMGSASGTMGMALTPFLAMWALMMTAMMTPAVTPVAALWALNIGRSAGSALRTLRLAAFVAGYLLAWAASGALAWLLMWTVEAWLETRRQFLGPVAFVVFAAAGLYQLSPWKQACLSHCRSPLALVMQYASLRHRFRDLHAGLHHGLYCLGCCWALMAVLATVGLMNIAAMVALTVLIFLEKLTPAAWRLPQLTGVGLLAIATWLVL